MDFTYCELFRNDNDIFTIRIKSTQTKLCEQMHDSICTEFEGSEITCKCANSDTLIRIKYTIRNKNVFKDVLQFIKNFLDTNNAPYDIEQFFNVDAIDNSCTLNIEQNGYCARYYVHIKCPIIKSRLDIINKYYTEAINAAVGRTSFRSVETDDGNRLSFIFDSPDGFNTYTDIRINKFKAYCDKVLGLDEESVTEM